MCTISQAKIIVNHTGLYSSEDALIVRNIYVCRHSLSVYLGNLTKHVRCKCNIGTLPKRYPDYGREEPPVIFIHMYPFDIDTLNQQK